MFIKIYILNFSLHKNVTLIELFDVCLDLGEFALVVFLTGLGADSVDKTNVSVALVLVVDLVPLLLESLADLIDFGLAQTVLLGLELALQVLDHLVLVVDVLLDLAQVLGSHAVVLLLDPVDGLRCAFGHRQDIFDRVADYEVLA